MKSFFVLLLVPILAAFLSAAPDPDIFDGSKLPGDAQKHFSLSKILKSVSIPKLPRSSKQQSRQGGQQGGGGQQGRQGGGGQQQGGGGQQGNGQTAQGQGGRNGGNGNPGEAIDPNAKGKAIGGELAEIDPDALKGGGENKQGEGGKGNSGEGQQGQGKENDGMGAQGGKGGLAGMRGGANITLGSAEDMIESASQNADQSPREGAEGDAIGKEVMDGSIRGGKPMAGKNGGRSIGVEKGQSFPGDL